LRKKFEVVASFKTNERSAEQFVAIMEGKDLPIYVFTYSIEMTQFVFADAVVTNTDMLDHTIPARTHAQYISN
jgi:hypothetical protein